MSQRWDRSTGLWISLDPSLHALLNRLESLSLEPGFVMEREGALASFLQPYAGLEASHLLSPLPEEHALAKLCLYADYLPRGGQPSLIEQVRDLIEVHVPEEEREWLDPLRHSAMDVLEITGIQARGAASDLETRSLGDQRTVRPAPAELARPVEVGQVMLTRVVARGEQRILCGTGLLLAKGVAASVLAALNEARREMEGLSGSFDLGDWREFTKRYGHLLLWQVAQTRMSRLIETESATRYETARGTPFLPAVALYEHHDERLLQEELDSGGAWRRVAPGGAAEAGDGRVRVWERGEGLGLARIALTPRQLWVECASRDRLEAIKHDLASAFGFSLHFRGETFLVPRHQLVEPDLGHDQAESRVIPVSVEQEHRLWASFLEEVYLEWADKPSPALGGRTPRHAAASTGTRTQVAEMIDRIQQDDPVRHRTGRAGYDYDQLRSHVGL